MSVHMEFELHALFGVHVADGKAYMCNPSIRNAQRSIRGREGLLDALITFILHLLIYALGIMRFFDRRPQPFTHSHSDLEENCRSKSPNISPAAILTERKIRRDRRKNVGYCNLWPWAVFLRAI